MATRTSIHGARDISAEAGGTTGAPLSIQIRRDYPAVYDEITLFTEDQALSRKLADAINETIAAHKAEQAAQHRDVKPFGTDDGRISYNTDQALHVACKVAWVGTLTFLGPLP
jgi:hypothetical protein